MIQTATMAAVYEAQGLKEEALAIYESILQETPNNTEALIAVNRLKGNRRSFEGVNQDMLGFFTAMDSDVEFAEFERWLAFETI